MKKPSIIFALILTLSVFIPISAFAAENNSAWVYDEFNVISPETEEYIRALNEAMSLS